MALPKSVRFEVLKRDNFTCRYCGRQSPQVVLNVDHIIPVSKGGTDDWDNLVTSCFGCNSGKSNRPLDGPPIMMVYTQEETYEQFKARLDSQVDKIQEYWQNDRLCELVFTESFRQSVLHFIRSLGFNEVMSSMEHACKQMDFMDKSPDDVALYFCGICWRKIKSK